MAVERYDVPCANCGETAVVEIEDGRVLSAVCECDASVENVCPDVEYARTRCYRQRWRLEGHPSLDVDSLGDDCGEPRTIVQWRSPGYYPPGAADEGNWQ